MTSRSLACARSLIPAPVARLLVLIFLLIHIVPLAHTYVRFYGPSDGYTLAGGRPVGGDFVAFYQAGQVVRADPRRLYDWEYFADTQQAFFRRHGIHAGVLVFAYPPLMAYVFSTLVGLSLLQAYLAWTGISLLLFGWSLWIVFRRMAANTKTVLLAFLFALADTLTFVFFFLSACYRDEKLQLSIFIIHF